MSFVYFMSCSDNWSTPQFLFDYLDRIYGFTLDPCASDLNHKCDKYFTASDDGLSQDWSNEIVFCNPPYGREIGKWVHKSYVESRYHSSTVVMLIPAMTDTKWFHEWILDKASIYFIKGRIKFGGCCNSAPFPSMVVVFSPFDDIEISSIGINYENRS